MITLEQIMTFYENHVPIDDQASWDNCGLQIGAPDKEVTGIVFALDSDHEAIDYLLQGEGNLLFTHHPLFMKTVKSLREDQGIGDIAMRMIREHILLYASHTNYDKAEGGVSDALAQRLGLNDLSVLVPDEDDPRKGYGRLGYVKPVAAKDFLQNLKDKLNLPHLVYYGSADHDIYKVAVLGGSGGDFASKALEQEADIYITADIDHHDALDHIRRGLLIVDIGHDVSEDMALDRWQEMMRYAFPELPTRVFRRAPIRKVE